ncbi:DALR anticodon-binding domain-containing protein [Streptomyces sp. RP5T]|uniref:CHAD domain-containing protein n=1 Tax=Streptomyces sp. RP5T TaxID=2490848 RepID=UPI000F651FAA|nr:DALR anticodon-binding domain-containing protein [Streptomyces sp. RP5T]RRR86721.1 CHAD domain-containing protein [Streptomyces sp. RP5T]
MAQQHLEPTDPLSGHVGPSGVPAGDALAGYLRSQATEFLRALRQHRESGGAAAGAEDPADAARALRRSVRRISASLHTFRPVLDPDWSESLRPELAWLSGTLGMEHAYESRLERLLLALHRLSGAVFPAQPRSAGTTPAPAPDRGNLTVGAAKASALLDRQLTHARTRALSRNAADLGFHAEPGDVDPRGDTRAVVREPGVRQTPVHDATPLRHALADHPRVLQAAAAHHAPDRLARHLVVVADAVLPFLVAVLPRGAEKPSAAHRARLALAEAAGAVLAGGLSLLGIDAPEHL